MQGLHSYILQMKLSANYDVIYCAVVCFKVVYILAIQQFLIFNILVNVSTYHLQLIHSGMQSLFQTSITALPQQISID